MPKLEDCTREELYVLAVNQQHRLRLLGEELNSCKRRCRRLKSVDKPIVDSITQRYIELEKINDELIDRLYVQYSRIAALTKTEPPSLTDLQNTFIHNARYTEPKC